MRSYCVSCQQAAIISERLISKKDGAVKSGTTFETISAYKIYAEDASKIAEDIRGFVKALYGEKASDEVRVIYGGSLDKENIRDFSGLKNIDGVLVGGSSLEADDFVEMIKKFE